ncbi:MAG: DUF1801 domain-containing protein [Hoeflea sp.]|uniref:DUF1801 domain-containing protein n=1 Tax=Hoeflea sp. TaxID=1940281 RepID=UPI0032EF7FB5
MPENKTRPTRIDPAAVISALDEGPRKRDAETLDAMMRRVSGAEPVMWGAAMFGYGSYRYAYSSGRTGTFFRAGFALRSRQIVVYVIPGFEGAEDELARLGPHKTGKSCLYLKRLDDIDMTVLERIVARSIVVMAERYPEDGG